MCKECITEDDTPPQSSCSSDSEEGTPSCAHDIALFQQQSTPSEDCECPICFLPLPLNNAEISYQSCCGKLLCVGCIYGVAARDDQISCPFCRAPDATSDEELIERIKKRAGANDACAIHQLGGYYDHGSMGLTQDYKRAVELWLRAGELGCSMAYDKIGLAYLSGQGVERDMSKAKYYWELGAIRGNVVARHNLGIFETREGNVNRALKHYMIAACAGYDNSLKEIQEAFTNGDATRDDLEEARSAHKIAKDGMRSDQREAAAAAMASAQRNGGGMSLLSQCLRWVIGRRVKRRT